MPAPTEVDVLRRLLRRSVRSDEVHGTADLVWPVLQWTYEYLTHRQYLRRRLPFDEAGKMSPRHVMRDCKNECAKLTNTFGLPDRHAFCCALLLMRSAGRPGQRSRDRRRRGGVRVFADGIEVVARNEAESALLRRLMEAINGPCCAQHFIQEYPHGTFSFTVDAVDCCVPNA